MVFVGNFNSHTREGVTEKLLPYMMFHIHFNSHTREGVTILMLFYTSIKYISTHTPVRV